MKAWNVQGGGFTETTDELLRESPRNESD